jgi:hypothetical protein
MEQILLLAAFLLLGLINAIVRWLQRRPGTPGPEPEAPRSEPETRLPVPRTRPAPAAAPVHARVPPREPAVSAPRRMPSAAPDVHARRRRRVHPRLGRRADLRRAIVVMTVLGPCRALEREPGATAP